MISYQDFEKIELRVGKIISAEKIENSEKLIKLKVDFKDETRQIVAGIGKSYQPEELVNKLVVVVYNLEPKEIFGYQSQGMLLAASDGSNVVLISPEKEISLGTKVK